jgi:Domain of unknown function (DUF4838)
MQCTRLRWRLAGLVAVLFVLVAATAQAAPAKIVIAKDAPHIVAFAAKELQEHFQKISGEEFPIVTDELATSGPVILVGKSRATDKLGIREKFDSEAFIIQSKGNALVLMGEDRDMLPGFYGYEFNYRTSHKGTLFAVYTLLEKHYGVRWLWPGPTGEIIPKRDKIILPKKVNQRGKPSFAWRHIWWYSITQPKAIRGELSLWYMRNKLGIGFGTHGSFAHSWVRYMDGNKHFEAHPEWYALIRGKRTPYRKDKKGKTIGMGRQVCTSNPEVVALFVRKLRERYDPKDDVLASISPNDGSGFCECAKCKALDHPELYGPLEGYDGQVHSDRIFTFVNAIAREIRKTHPRLRLAIYSYTYLRPSPRTIKKLEPNIVIGTTQISAFYSDPAHKAHDRKRIEEWVARGGVMLTREYMGDYHWLHFIHPQTAILAEDLRYQKSKGFAGFTSESGVDFASNHMNYYVMARLLWNVDQDLDALIADFCKSAFGPASAKMSAYYTFMEKNFASRSVKDKSWHASTLPNWNQPAAMTKAQKLLDEARAIAGDDAIRARIDYVRIGLNLTQKTAEFLRLCQRLNDAGLPISLRGYTKRSLPKTPTKAEVVALVKEAKAKGDELFAYIKQFDNSSAAQPWPLVRTDETYRWRATVNDYVKLYGGQSGEASTPLPIPWRFKTDPKNEGEGLGWHKADFNDKAWGMINTDAIWEKQGHKGYDGHAWYRLGDVNIQANKGATVLLRIGAIDEDCRVYVNGQFAGAFTFDAKKDPDSWKKPQEFDITRFVKPGAKNVIAVQVHDSLLAGGMWKRAFIIVRDAKGSATPKVAFSEGFEGESLDKKIRFGGDNHKVSLIKDGAHKGKQCLQIKLNAPLPSECSVNWTGIPVEPGATYTLSAFYRIIRAEENAGEDRKWRRRPSLPGGRIIFKDAKGKTVGTTKQYVWVRSPFQTKTDGWKDMRKVFVVPQTATKLNLKISFAAKGEYLLDEVKIATW